MAQRYKALRGMDDILPGEVEKWQWLEDHSRYFFESRGFKEIRTPSLELTELFSRSVGEASDIVHKEMFSFQDRGGRHVSLRPEMTASVARAVIQNGLLTQAKSLRLYYLGPMFRAERPQAGRKRQFHQIGIEMINETGLKVDLEAMLLLYHFLKLVGVQDVRLCINDLGGSESQEKIAKKLKSYFSGVKDKLCEDCLYRLERNVLRIFDCKVESCQKVIRKAPWEDISPLGKEFESLTEKLAVHQVAFEINRRLVRGLDYYNGIVFEVVAKGLGAQDAIAGGGRYDRLYRQLGGPQVPCTGFSVGIERLLAVLKKTNAAFDHKIKMRHVYLAGLESTADATNLLQQNALVLRQRGFRIESSPGETSLSRHLKKANQLGIRFVLILGSDEIKRRKWTLRDMEKREQTQVSDEELVSYLEGKLSQ